MKLRPALAVLAVLAGCGHGGSAQPPQGLPTLPPGGAIKDGLLYAAVKARLAGSDLDSTTRVSVAVHGGVVTLTGAVPTLAAKERDAKLVRSMRGVVGVDDKLRVGHAGPSLVQTVRDASLVAAVASNLTAQTGVNVAGIHVRAEGSTVILAGYAPTAAIRSTLVAAAQHTPGVRNVVDRIAVK